MPGTRPPFADDDGDPPPTSRYGIPQVPLQSAPDARVRYEADTRELVPEPGYWDEAPPSVAYGGFQQPHRGGMILALGICGILVCVVLGIPAWVMGNTDIRKMNAGQMDASGRDLTQAGRILGMISVILGIIGLAFFLFMFLTFESGLAWR